MDKAVIYIHGKGGDAEEALHYKSLFSDCDVIGLDYALLLILLGMDGNIFLFSTVWLIWNSHFKLATCQ